MKTLAHFPFAACLFAFALTGMAAETKADKAETKDPMAEDLAAREGADFENAFLALMTHHHRGGIEMARLATTKAEEPKIKTMAEKMIPTQTQEIEQMTGWLKEWGGKTPEDYPMPEASKKQTDRAMAKLAEVKGAEFDKLFLRHMSSHHRGGVTMSELVPGKTEKAELKQLAAKIADQQSREIKEMRQMRKK